MLAIHGRGILGQAGLGGVLFLVLLSGSRVMGRGPRVLSA